MILEVWTYKATNPSNGAVKPRPVLIIGNDGKNGFYFADIHYCIISSSAKGGIYDVVIDTNEAAEIGLSSVSVIKTTKLYTGSESFLGGKIGDLPKDLAKQFVNKYKEYQSQIINQLEMLDGDIEGFKI